MSEENKAVESAETVPQRERVRVRWWHIVLLIAAAVTCLLLANWQWERYQSGSGTFQNLGYAIQWPIFGGFLVYFYLRIRRYENDKLDADEFGEELAQLEKKDKKKKVTTVSQEWMPNPVNTDVEAYNEEFAPRRRKGRDD